MRPNQLRMRRGMSVIELLESLGRHAMRTRDLGPLEAKDADKEDTR